jgi:hypothetical protein
MEGRMVQEKQLVEDDLDVDLLQTLLAEDTQNGQNNLDNVIRFINQRED